MEGLKAKIDAFQRSKLGQFVKKVLDDQAPNLASLLAWQTLSALLPLVLGILAVSGLVLRDPQRLDQVYNTLMVLVPQSAAGPLGDALNNMRHQAAAPASIVGLVLLLYNGSGLFSSLAGIFDQAYHVEGRNFVLENLIAVVMLIVTTVLLIVSTLALGLGAVFDQLPLGLPFGPVVGKVISWSISIVSAFLLFLLVYRIEPNAKQGWRNVLPGTIASLVLFFVILMIFPLYMSLFPPDQAYAQFGLFLAFTFWLYLLGWVFVLGAELNAFLLQPARSVALAEATSQAQQGKAAMQEQPGQVQAHATGAAPEAKLGGPLRSRAVQGGATGSGDEKTDTGASQRQPQQTGSKPSAGTTIAGKVLGFVGLIVAAILIRGKTAPEDKGAAVPSGAE